MVDATAFYQAAVDNGIDLICGVPDSLLKNLCTALHENATKGRHVVVPNEGAGIALATGHYLATGRIGLVYMQNSGLGNAINPLLSLTSRDVYQIPLVILIGWRGQPGRDDEPQHLFQGRVTLPLLETLEIPCQLLPSDTAAAVKCLGESVVTARALSGPVAIVVQSDTFGADSGVDVVANGYELSREEAMATVVGSLDGRDAVVVTTGKASREVYEYRRDRGPAASQQEFLTLGSMGHASHIALGVALSQPDRRVFCLDGDGALLMHMGSLALIGSSGPRQFVHVVLNNGCHESVGGQPTVGFEIDIPRVAEACGYSATASVSTVADLRSSLQRFREVEGPCLLEVRISASARKDLGRPQTAPSDGRDGFMEFLRL